MMDVVVGDNDFLQLVFGIGLLCVVLGGLSMATEAAKERRSRRARNDAIREDAARSVVVQRDGETVVTTAGRLLVGDVIVHARREDDRPLA